MRAWPNAELPKKLIIGILCGLLALPALADGIFVSRANTVLDGKIYRLDAEIEYRFSKEVLRALHNGVTLVISLDIEVERPRSYMWNETVVGLKQRYELTYHALSEQYLVRNTNSGARYSFPSLAAATEHIGTLADFPMLDQNLLDSDGTYTGRIRARLDTEDLPTPLRLLSYVSSGWRLSSGWYLWPIQH